MVTVYHFNCLPKGGEYHINEDFYVRLSANADKLPDPRLLHPMADSPPLNPPINS